MKSGDLVITKVPLTMVINKGQIRSGSILSAGSTVKIIMHDAGLRRYVVMHPGDSSRQQWWADESTLEAKSEAQAEHH